MPLSHRFAVLLPSLLLLATTARAQTPLGQPTLEEQKVQIWCATVKFVYEDTGRPNLKSRLSCGGSLKEFESSIKPDSQRVYSALYQPLEGRGVMYKGLGSDNSRLQKLTTEIINRLKASPARRASPARMQNVAVLETALKNYVDNGTPIGELNTAAAETTADPATDEEVAPVDEATAAAPSDAGPAEAGVASPVPPTRSAGESLMNKFFGPLALILSLLSLVLYALLRRSIGAFQRELSARIDKRRDEILALQNAPVGSAVAGATAEKLSAAQQRELERLVQQQVREEVEKLREQLTAAASLAVSRLEPTPPVVPAASVAPVTAPASYTQPAAYTPAPAATAEPVAAPAAEPAPPAPAPADEFDALVPPVQLAGYEAPEPQPRTRYVKVPVNGAFSEYDLADEPQHDSIYEIHLDPQWPELATFSVTQNPAVHAYAIQSAQYSLREACRYQQPTGAVARIVTEEEGVLRKVGSTWQIEQKAGIRFE
ncbi:flagellar biosynthesis protein FlhF [Hymenobacter weizhouensis]|uniref:hypothetical protein n=1 Tax=Hymenobacter sp. YIM 151500-1 TaxID=2987689 RepID=UPI00222785E8|nr:hypothetical protein [Hymenobacter sp. YIM 151500-1]UYZ61947.1 hypothetical protein OIS53_13155 [Hymenobacter sp. YIM 151500-1]